MVLKVEVESKKKPKFFTGGMPQVFTLSGDNGSEIKATIGSSGKVYNITVPTGKSSLNAAGLREVANHFAELADMLEAKIAA